MEYSDLLKSGLGAVIGFALAQLVSLAKVGRDWFTRPRLRIESPDSSKKWLILMHSAEFNSGEIYKEEIYGFYVRNVGRRIATGVRFQLLKIEYRDEKWPTFADVSDHTQDLFVYNESSDKRGIEKITLVPGAKTLVHLGSWREDYNKVVIPAVNSIPDYYEEICRDAVEFRFTVVAFDDLAGFTTAVATMSHRGHREG